ncbi:MAG: KTSC domain-containing protein [Calothrix sp. MO_167.B12]|nr:KTSC domain-containing protein [Calothrix sp. MO_167.B12]
MKLSRLYLSSIVAIAHSGEYLQLLIDRGNELELLEVPAPVEAYEGLQELNEIVADSLALPTIDEAIAMLPVESSMANAVGYDSDEEVLQVEFNNGAIYQYTDVDDETWDGLYKTDSIGKFFNSEIRGKYQYERLD